MILFNRNDSLISDLLTPNITGGSNLTFKVSFYFCISNDYLTFVTLAWSTKPVLSRWGIFVAIANNTVRLCLSVSCVSPPLVPIFGQFLFLSSFVIISSQPCVFSWLVPSPVSLIILFAPSFPSLYKSSVFPVSLSSINVISLSVYLSPAISVLCLYVSK